VPPGEAAGGRPFLFSPDELDNWGRHPPFNAAAGALRAALPRLWNQPDPRKSGGERRRGNAAAPVLLVLAGTTTNATAPANQGFRPPIPFPWERAARLCGFGSHAAIAAGLRRIDASRLGSLEMRAKRVTASGHVLRGQAQRLALHDSLFSKPWENAQERAARRALGLQGYVSIPASWFYTGHIASLPGAARHLLLVARAWEPVQDEERYIAPMIERGVLPADARMQARSDRALTAAPLTGWAERAGMDRRAFEAALNILTRPVLGRSVPYLRVGGVMDSPSAPVYLITTPIANYPAPLSFDQLNRPLQEVSRLRRALHGED
jgi:hypothetical protein